MEVEFIAWRRGVPAVLLGAIVQVESGWNPEARGAAGEIGLGQLMPETARALKVDPRDPAQNLDGAARYLRAMAERFGGWEVAIAAYNAGETNVARAGGRAPSEAVRAYVGRVLSAARVISGADA
jgi:soluble lytic murein transglycosylase-like protein